LDVLERVYLFSKLMCKLYAKTRLDTVTDTARLLGVSVQDLSRVIHLREIPSSRRIRELLSRLEGVDSDSVLVEAMREAPLPFPHLNNLTSRYPLSLYCFLYKAFDALRGRAFSLVLTVEGSGLILATLISLTMGKRLVYGVKGVKMVGGQVVSAEPGPAYAVKTSKRIISFPSRADLRGERVVIVDGVVWTGSTIHSMLRYVERKSGVVDSVLIMAATRRALSRLEKLVEAPVYPLLLLDGSTSRIESRL